jgi:hypothetical protein
MMQLGLQAWPRPCFFDIVNLFAIDTARSCGGGIPRTNHDVESYLWFAKKAALAIFQLY